MIRPDMFQIHDEPSDDDRKACLACFVLVYASGFLMGVLFAAWLIL